MPIEFPPPGLPVWATVLLLGASLLTSALSAAVGIGGGVLLLALMANAMPVAVLLPVHGLIQTGSNAGRAVLLARHAALGLLLPFAAGALAGVAAGALLVTDLPEELLRLGIGVFVVWTAVAHLPSLGRGSRAVLAAGGFGSTLLTMFVGATGPFVLALYRQTGLARLSLVGTTAVAMTLQHGLKVLAFAALGFSFAAWLPFVVAMIAAGFAGTWLGTRILARLPERVFRRALAIVLAALGLQLIARAAWSLVA